MCPETLHANEQSPRLTKSLLNAPVAWIATLLALVLVFSLPKVLGYGIIDDAYISLRYGHNLAQGHGLVFNVGEYVEGYTNFLWTLFLGLGQWLGADGPSTAVWGGLVAGGLTLVATVFLHARVARTGKKFDAQARGTSWLGWRIASTPLALAVSPTFLAYAASGLESTAYALLLVLHALFLLGHRSAVGNTRALAGAGLTLALANLTRPEASAIFVFDLVALAVLFFQGRNRPEGPFLRAKGFFAFAAAFALPFGAFLLWRHATYGQWLPNTYFAKVGGPSTSLLGSGEEYALAVGFRTLSFAGIALGLWAAWVRRDLRLAYLAALTLVLLVVIALVGGDHMSLWRFGLPLLPFSAILVREGLRCLTKERLPEPAGALLVVLFFGAAGLWTARSVRLHDMPEQARAQLEVDLAKDWSTFGRWLARYADPGDTIALLPIGAVGYYSGLNVIDQVGLVDEHIAHLDVETGSGYVGHEKFDNDYVLGRAPRFVMGLHLVTLKGPINQQQYDASAFFEVHKDLLRRSDLHRDYTFRCLRAGDHTYFAFYERN